MRIRCAALLALVFGLAFLLTGCMRTELDISLRADETGVITKTVAIKEDVYNVMVQSGSDPFSERETKTVIYDETPYIACSEISERLPYSELEKELMSIRLDPSGEECPLLFQDVLIAKDGGLFSSSYTFKARTNPQENGDESQSVNDMFKFVLKVTMPGKIAEVKEGVIEKNSVTITVQDLTLENDYAVYSHSNNIGLIIAITAAFALILGIVFFFVKRR